MSPNTSERPLSLRNANRPLAKNLLTFAGTLGGSATLLYAGVLEGYGHFYYALGLRLSNVSLNTEQVLAPMALIALVFTVLFALVALGLWSGVAAASSARRREQPIATYIVALAVILVTAFDWRPSPELATLIGFTHLIGMIGPLVAAPSQKESIGEGSESGRVVKLMAAFWPFCILTSTGIALKDLPRLTLPGAQMALVLLLLIAGRQWLRRHGGPITAGDPTQSAADGAREVWQLLVGGRLRRFVLLAATAFAIILAPIGLVEKWETDLWERGLAGGPPGRPNRHRAKRWKPGISPKTANK
ncbi:hypothetical protein [Glycomyces buryatensis]|uniref:DUF998 domain-containing protein n=1 Tax=Glycomyces buryatensis TaxID=2570927 RepID=A0A4V4HQY7_9ACTN|nr:hypothetical protein [Glycomyces buryatensis]THV35676.1 hypothetical protein FAB82_22640 [Glycomyces buryatensis]